MKKISRDETLASASDILRHVFKAETVANPPWPRMILCATATLLPLLCGILAGELPLAIFGGLSGYLLALNDHLGTLRHRLFVTSLSAVILAFGFMLGFHFQNEEMIYYVVLGGVSYWLGLLGGDGAELERAVLFSLVGFITAFTTVGITGEQLGVFLKYALIAYGCLVIGGPLVYWIGRHQAGPYASLRNSLRISFTKRHEKHIHALCFVVTVLFSVWFSGELRLEHGSWVTITVLIVLRPDRRLTVYKTLQRFVGTLAGVLVADLILMLHPGQVVLLLLLTLCAFVIPWAMQKSYWLTSFFVTVFVVILLDLAGGRRGDMHLATLRLEATFVGCSLSLAGVGLARSLDRLLGRLGIFQTPRI